MDGQKPIYGLMAEFDDATALVEATKRTYDAGYRKVDAYSPYPIEELSHALGFHHSPLPLLVLLGGLFGLAAVYGLQYWSAVIE